MENILSKLDKNIKLDDEQQRVVLDDSKHLIVVAGAGTGKTLTLTAKVKYLIEVKKIKSKEILIISLTNKAIDELKARINTTLGLNIEICTFHKLAYNILKEEDIRYKINTNQEKIIYDYIKNDKETNHIIRLLRKDKLYRRMDNNIMNSVNLLSKKTLEIINLIKILSIDINNIKVLDKISKSYIEFLKKIKNHYEEILEKNYELDFEDLIIKASKLKNIKMNYKYIIVDEYQDISINRYRLLKRMIEVTKASTIVVGDDFQTIFSFAGSNINLFLDYQKNMNAKILKITSTYRNSQQLIDVAGKFVMKNDKQIKKKLTSKKNNDKPIKICGYKNDFDLVFKKIIDSIIKKHGRKCSILVLGRYKNDILKLKSKEFKIKDEFISYIKYRDVKIVFLTIHASKGLGYDNVVLINFNNDYRGFPSNIKDCKFIKEILNNDSNIEEERRLFYVALTRTKNKIYIMTKIKEESSFMKEIYNDENVSVDYNFKIIKSHSKHRIK